MIGFANPNRPLCVRCANPCSGDLTIDHEAVCAGCLETAIAADAADAVGNYRYQALEWFQSHSDERAERDFYAWSNHAADCRGAA